MDEATRMTLRGVTFQDPQGRPVAHDGTTPVTWRVGAFALAVRDDRVLLVERASGGRLELPGGGVEVHETLLAGATRECLEETGYRFVAADPAPVYLGELFFRWHQSAPPTPGPRYWHALLAVFAGTVEGDPAPGWTPDPHEMLRAQWVDLATLTPELMLSQHWAALRRAGLV